MADRDFKDLTSRTASNKIMRDKAFNIAKKTRNMMDLNVDFLQRSINFLIEKTSGGTLKSRNISNKGLAEELHK